MAWFVQLQKDILHTQDASKKNCKHSEKFRVSPVPEFRIPFGLWSFEL